MFHHKPVFLPHHTAAQEEHPALSQRISQKRHPKPDHFYRAGQIFQTECCHLHSLVPGHLDAPEHTARHSADLSFLHAADGHRILKDLKSSRIIAKNISNGVHSYFPEQVFRFFSDAFQGTDTFCLSHYRLYSSSL